MTYQEFKAEWQGRRIDYDHVYAYQCVDLILEYVKECYGLPSGIWGNAIDYWTHTSAPLLTKFDKVHTTDCKQGDIVVLNGLSGNPYGHIGICDHQDGQNVWLLEQNATGSNDGLGRSAIGIWRAIPKTRIAGVLRPKAKVALPTYYTVQKGDTLSKIAQAHHLTLQALEKLNPVTNFKSHNYDLIHPGEKVRIK